MDTPIIVAIISPAASLLIGLWIFYLTKQKEQEFELQKAKRDQYAALLAAVSDLAENPRDVRSFARARNSVVIVSSPSVLVEMDRLIKYIQSKKSDEYLKEEQDKIYTEIIYAIREDLGVKPARADLVLEILTPSYRK